MEADAVLSLFDSLWYYPQMLSQVNPNPQIDQNNLVSNSPPQLRRIHTRSKSEELFTTNAISISISSPDSVILKPTCLETILSQKEFQPETPKLKGLNYRKIRKQKRALSKSLSELEFEELKGFMDLGFVFSAEDRADSSLVEIIPGLQRLGQKQEDDAVADHGSGEMSRPRSRPYLSEAWQESDEQLKQPLVKWKIPIRQVNSEVDMKDSLKWWAHTVASAVR